MPIPALIGAAGALLASGANALFNKSNNAANVANQWALFNAQNRRQDFLNANADLIKRNSLLKAGLNVNSDFGGSPNLVGSTVTPANQQAFQIDPALFAQLPSLMANARLTNAQAENQEIVNNREKSKDKQSNRYMNNLLSNDKLFGKGYNNVVKADLDGGELSNTTVLGKRKTFNYGDFEFYRLEKQFGNELKEFSYNDAKWSLEKMVSKAQRKDKEVLQALIDLPKAQLEQLTSAAKLAVEQSKTSAEQGQLFDAEEALIKLQEKIQKESNLSQIFDDMMKNGLSLENVGRLLIGCFVNFFKSSVVYSFGH